TTPATARPTAQLSAWPRHTRNAASSGNTISHRPANCRSSFGLGFAMTSDHCMSLVQLELRQVLFPCPRVQFLRHVFLQQDDVLEHERVHLRAEETAVRVLGRADDRLAADVEAGVDEHRASRAL